jgi:hypothetical protein
MQALRKMMPEQRFKFQTYILEYGTDGTEPEGLTPFEAAFWEMARALIDNLKPKKGGQPGNRNAKKEAENQLNSNENEENQINQLNSCKTNETNENECANEKRIETNENECANLKINKYIYKYENENQKIYINKNTHSESDSESIPSEPLFEDEKNSVCEENKDFDPNPVINRQNEAENPPEYNETPPEYNKTAGEYNKKPPEYNEKPPEYDRTAGEYDKYAALHPGHSPPNYPPDYAQKFQELTAVWNDNTRKVPLPPFRRNFFCLNSGQREIFMRALQDFSAEDIINAVKNYQFVRDNQATYSMAHNYASIFTFLEKGIGTFYLDENIDPQFLRKERKNGT